jgi:hypothetical protein
MRTRTIRRHPRLAVALGVTSMALIAANPASAISRGYAGTDEPTPTTTERVLETTNETPPVDENGKKSCPVAKNSGGTQWMPHGTTITVTLPDGTAHSTKCNDGEWEMPSGSQYADAYAAEYFFSAAP